MRTAALLALCALLAACGEVVEGVDAGPGADAGADEATAELGTGDTEFEPLSDGDELAYILGPQGGYHFLASVRVSGVEPGDPSMRTDPNNPQTEFRAFRGEQRIDARASSYIQGLDPVPGEDGVHQMVGRLLILNIDSCDALTGETIRLEVTVTDVNGVTATDTRTVTAVPDPLTCGG